MIVNETTIHHNSNDVNIGNYRHCAAMSKTNKCQPIQTKIHNINQFNREFKWPYLCLNNKQKINVT